MSDWWMKTVCDRCSKADALIMSMYNHEMICGDCKEAERKRPDYHAAEATDLREYAVRLDGLGMGVQADSVRKAAADIEQRGPLSDP